MTPRRARTLPHLNGWSKVYFFCKFLDFLLVNPFFNLLVLQAMLDDNDQLPSLLTDYILNGEFWNILFLSKFLFLVVCPYKSTSAWASLWLMHTLSPTFINYLSKTKISGRFYLQPAHNPFCFLSYPNFAWVAQKFLCSPISSMIIAYAFYVLDH